MKTAWQLIPLLLGLSFSAPALTSAADVTSDFFDGKSLNAWMKGDGKPAGPGWEVVDSAIHLKKGVRSGNILTRKVYGDFRLTFEWAISTGGNSGIKYRVTKFGKRDLGCEYQVYDDAAKKLGPKHTSASLYAIYEPMPPATSLLKPPGQFNTGVIQVSGNKIEHWLNGTKVVSATVGSSEWNQRIAKSKFAKVEGFGRNREGRLMLTDHGSEVWYRNFKMEALPPPTQFASQSSTSNRLLSRWADRRASRRAGPRANNRRPLLPRLRRLINVRR